MPIWVVVDGAYANAAFLKPAMAWDKASRRPSHADKRRAWRREMLGEEIRAALRPGVAEHEIQATAERLPSLAA